jgi:hypothetical protein
MHMFYGIDELGGQACSLDIYVNFVNAEIWGSIMCYTCNNLVHETD